jgi:hypothetical protein
MTAQYPTNVQGRSHLAQINIAKMLAPITDPVMADFVAQLSTINAIADTSSGFVWRLKSEDNGNATNIRAFDDEFLLVNLSVWESFESLFNYVYRSQHLQVMGDRRRWFERSNEPTLALWWVVAGHIPTLEEAKERLEHLRQQGSTSYAFSFARSFPPPSQNQSGR